MSMVGFPLLLIPLAICNILIFLMPGVSFATILFTLPLPSGVGWQVNLNDVILALGALMLLFEVMKGARPGAKYFTDHLLSLIVFGGAAAEFAMLPQFGSSTYFLLTLLAMVDFLSGVSLRARRPRGATVAASAKSSARNETPPDSRPDPVATTPMVEPAPPKPAPHVTHSEVASPEVQSPGIQPGTHAPPDTPPH